MDKCLSICDVVFSDKKITIEVQSKHTYLGANLICSFSREKTKILSYKSNAFDLFEGKQSLIIPHCFSELFIHNLILTVELINREGTQIGCFSQKINVPGNTADAQSCIEVRDKIVRTTDGGYITISVGGVVCRIHTHHNEVLEWCKDYISMDDPFVDISVSEEEIIDEKRELDNLKKYPPSDSKIEMYAIRKKVSDSILDYGGFQIHGAAIAVNNQGYIFTADSGTGKTTHIQLWLKHLQNAYVVNGDQPIVKTGPVIQVCGSPWCGKEGMNTNTAVPLKAIIIMERSNKNVISEISMKEAVIELLQQVYRPSDPDKYRKTLQLLSLLDGEVKFYRFKFDNFADDAFSVCYKTVYPDG